jgi:dTDP-4-dehydrorhamnose reductase
MKVFIVGASGLVGSHCMRVFENANWDVIGTHLSFATDKTVYFDPLSNSSNNFNLKAYKPDVIIHCAALTNVDYCELNRDESKSATLTSTQRLAEYCQANNTKLIYISTDYVFDGINGPYREDAEPNPLNIYGKHKLEAEQIVEKLDNSLIARITNVYGEELRSKNFIARLVLLLQSNDAKEIQLTTDQFATPIYAGDVARMLYALITDDKNGIYHLSSTDYYNRFSLAERVKSYFPDNNSVKLKPVLTTYLKQLAKRPLYGGLLNVKFLNEYNSFKLTNVDDFVEKMIKL